MTKMSVERIINYCSIGLILIVGILVMVGFIGFLEPIYRIGFGLVIILYAGVRVVMTYAREGRGNR